MHEEITSGIIGAAMEVHSFLGPGFLESLYEEALAQELHLRGIRFARQLHVPVSYKGMPVGKHVLDLLVHDAVVVELKAISEVTDVHKAIVLSYLAATRLSVGLLLNCGRPSLEVKRVAR